MDDSYIVCQKCSKQYKSLWGDTNQADGLASSIRISQGNPNFGFLDGPPSNKMVKIGNPYIQCFYGSGHDGIYYRFTQRALTRLEKYSWFKINGCVCDNCIDELLKLGILEKAGEN
jgi:hypothetical protein